MPQDEAYRSNQALWEEWARLHPATDFYDLEGFKSGSTAIRIRDYEIEDVGDVTGKDLLHLQCHIGTDTLSWARLGARVTGVDYSEKAIEAARALAEELSAEARFVHSDVYALPDNLEGDFDIVYASRGVIGWLPDLPAWVRVAAHFVRPGGIFYLNDVHPFAKVFDDEEGVTELEVKYPYFESEEPMVFPTQGSYADRDATIEQEFEYDWPHSMGELISAVAGSGLRIELLREFPFLEWSSPPFEERAGRGWTPAGRPDLPLSFSLKARKDPF
jgi:SAM-dependent methyltransferase